jgi:hypothetical protein
MKSSVFRNIMPCSQLKINRRLGATYRLHLQGPRINQDRNQHESSSKQSSETSILNGLHGAISRKIELFIIIAVKTSDHA